MKIFMVDDDTFAMDPYLDVLMTYGRHQVEKVESEAAAEDRFERAKKQGKWPFDLLVLDVQIHDPQSNKDSDNAGLRLHMSFRQKFPSERVLILTNNMHWVPASLHEGPLTKARDKVDVSGRRILDAVKP